MITLLNPFSSVTIVAFLSLKNISFISHFSQGVKKMEDEMVRLNPLNNIQVTLNHRNLLYRVITFFLNLF